MRGFWTTLPLLPLQCADILISWGVFQLTGLLCLDDGDLQQKNTKRLFTPSRKHRVITPTEWENRSLSVGKCSLFSFLKKSFDQSLSMILSIRAPSSNFLWLRFHWYDGPTTRKETCEFIMAIFAALELAHFQVENFLL